MSDQATPAPYSSFVAIGDSFTEGLDDPVPAGGYRGWADRLAEHLVIEAPGLRYANLAVRGKLLRQIVTEQVPRAVELRPDLVAFSGGGNDLLRPGSDPDALARTFAAAVRRLRDAGAEVLMFTGFDTRDVPVLRRIRGKAATYNMHLRGIADAHGCRVVDLWSMRTLLDPRAWSVDRLHMSPEGHRRVALAMLEALGVPDAGDWREPALEPLPELSRGAQRLANARWARGYLAPWVGRRLRGRSSGDLVTAKRPTLAPIE